MKRADPSGHPAIALGRIPDEVGIALDAELLHGTDLLRTDGLHAAMRALGDFGDGQSEPNRRTISASRGVSRSLCEESTWLTKMSLIDGEKYWFRE